MAYPMPMLARVAQLLAAAALAVAAFSPAVGSAATNDYDGDWHFSVTPYGWFPSVNAKMLFSVPPDNGASPVIDSTPRNYLSDLRFVGMIAGDARRGNWDFAMDLVYVDLGNLKSVVRDVRGPGDAGSPQLDSNVDLDLKALIVQGIAGYTVARTRQGSLDVFAGVRYAEIKGAVDVDFSGSGGVLNRSASLSQTTRLTDGIVGVRGTVELGAEGRWYLPYYLDIGAGSSNRTWQGYAGVGYKFGWGDLVLVYRNLYYSATGDELLQHLRMGGPAVAATFRW